MADTLPSSLLLRKCHLSLPDSGVDALKDGDREGGRLAGTGLSLGNHVSALQHPSYKSWPKDDTLHMGYKKNCTPANGEATV